jgi:hypothetical protein
MVKRKLVAVALTALATAAVVTGVAAAAAPVTGSISGPVTSVSGKTFDVKTTLSPKGKAKVKVTSKTTIQEQVTATRADLKQGVCVTGMGTKKGTSVTAFRVSITPAVKGSCSSGTGRRPGGPGGGGGLGGGGLGGGGAGGAGRPTPPANFGAASGMISAVKGSTVTVKGQTGTVKLVVKSTTQIGKTVTLTASKIKKSMCAFVFGTSADKGVTVQAQSVNLSKPRNGSCTFGRPTP